VPAFTVATAAAIAWIVETAGSGGINYAVHSLCTSASLPEKTQTKNIVVRPLGPDRGDGTNVRRFKELSALSITIAESPSAIFVVSGSQRRRHRVESA
jgi:hypothetical protein